MFQIFKNNFYRIVMEIEHIIIGMFILIFCYFIFFKKETFINRKLENFTGDDLNVHMNDDLNVKQDVIVE